LYSVLYVIKEFLYRLSKDSTMKAVTAICATRLKYSQWQRSYLWWYCCLAIQFVDAHFSALKTTKLWNLV